jgi:hypothetical protein
MQFTSLRKPIVAILMLSMTATTLGSFAQPAAAKNPAALVANGIGSVAGAVASVVVQLKNDDKEKRAQFTQRTVAELARKYPNYNFVITRHKQSKAIGKSVVHKHVEMKQTVGTVGYEIFAAPKGKTFVFKRNGDGGFLNWAYRGKFKSKGGNTIFAVR